MEIEVWEIQSKIHNLRNQFSQETKKVGEQKSGQGAAEVYKSKWPYFDSLKFIKGAACARKITVNQTYKHDVGPIFLHTHYHHNYMNHAK